MSLSLLAGRTVHELAKYKLFFFISSTPADIHSGSRGLHFSLSLQLGFVYANIKCFEESVHLRMFT